MDECVAYVPGTRWIIDMKLDKKSGVYTPIYDVDPISKEYAKIVGDCMVKAMNEMLSPLIDGQEVGRASPEIGASWACK